MQPDRLSVLETCNSGVEAMQSYRRLHKQYPNREFYFVHTSREELNIHEIQWYGIRSSKVGWVERKRNPPQPFNIEKWWVSASLLPTLRLLKPRMPPTKIQKINRAEYN